MKSVKIHCTYFLPSPSLFLTFNPTVQMSTKVWFEGMGIEGRVNNRCSRKSRTSRTSGLKTPNLPVEGSEVCENETGKMLTRSQPPTLPREQKRLPIKRSVQPNPRTVTPCELVTSDLRNLPTSDPPIQTLRKRLRNLPSDSSSRLLSCAWSGSILCDCGSTVTRFDGVTPHYFHTERAGLCADKIPIPCDHRTVEGFSLWRRGAKNQGGGFSRWVSDV